MVDDDDKADKGGDGIRSVARALDVLLAFSPADAELSASDLLKRVDLSRPTLYRILHSLERKGFVTSSGEPQRFRIGPSIAQLAPSRTSSADIAVLAQPTLKEVWTHTGETVALFVPRDERRLCVAELPSAQPLHFKRGVGYSERLVRGASGRAILAFMTLDADALTRHAAGSGTDEQWLRDELAATRERGYAIGHNELIQGAYAVAAPFFDRHGEVAGSIGVFGPDVRLTPARMHEFGAYLVERAKSLSKAAGHLP
ncbi:MAG: transcriptional regulator, IclR family [Rhizobacter sp.]|nr:transcriptional regulator, IclR family [Rhizobacter sp.]